MVVRGLSALNRVLGSEIIEEGESFYSTRVLNRVLVALVYDWVGTIGTTVEDSVRLVLDPHTSADQITPRESWAG